MTRLRPAIVPVLIAAGVLLAGCSSGVVTAPSASPSTTVSHGAAASTAKAIPGLPAGVQPASSIPTSVPNDASARGAVSMTSCAATATGWSAGGTVTNAGTKSKKYTITVFFTTSSATVIDSAQTALTVDAGKKRTWSASRDFATAPGMLCVLRGVG